MQKPALLEVKAISKSYHDYQVFSDLSFELNSGQLLTVVGSNGVGKTSLLKILATVIPPSAGELKILGQPANKLRSLIGYLPETPVYYPDLRVIEQLKYFAKFSTSSADCLNETLALCQLEQVSSQIAGTLSRGYKQRLGLALLLIKQPKLLILDEPASALDPEQRLAFFELLKKIKSTQAMVISTHLYDFVEDLTDYLLVLKGEVGAQIKSRVEFGVKMSSVHGYTADLEQV